MASTRTKQQFRVTVIAVIFLAVAYIVFRNIMFYGSFLDEQENWVGAGLLHQGLRLYSDFFTHHAPLPYLLGQWLAPLAGGNWQVFRWFVLGLWMTAGVAGTLLLPGKKRLVPGLSLLILALVAPTFNLHQYLATTLAAVGLFMLCIGMVAMTLKNNPGKGVGALLISGSWLAIWSAPTTAPAVLVILSWYWWQSRRHVKIWVGVMALVPLYFLIRGSFPDFWWSLITYNAQHYAPLKLGLRQPAGLAIITQAFSFLVTGVTGLWVPLKTLGLTIGHTIGLTGFPALFQVAITSFISDYTQLKTALFLLFAVTTLAAIKVLGWRQAMIFSLVVLLLQWQTTEVFHGAPYVTVLLVEAVWVETRAFSKRYWGWLAGLLLALAAVGSPLISRYGEFWGQQFPMVATTDRETANRLKPQTGGTLMVLNASPILYPLAQKQPALKTYYVFAWIAAVPDFRQQIETALTTRRADYVVMGEVTGADEPWLTGLQPLLDQGYQPLGNGVYIRKP